MATSSYTPLQLTLAANMIDSSGLKMANTALETALNNYLANFTSALADTIAVGLSTPGAWISSNTIGVLRFLSDSGGTGRWLTGSPDGPNSILTTYYGQAPLLVDYINQLTGYYRGLGPYPSQTPDYSLFAQIFAVVSGFVASTNQVVFANENANTYLGPTFSSMDALTTANISDVNPVFDRFGYDLARQGNLVNTANLDLYGTPAGVIQQISAVAGLQGSTTPALESAMVQAGADLTDIRDLVTDNRVSLFNQDGLLDNDFDRIQKLAYQAMTTIRGDDLTQILQILGVTTPNITSLDQLLDPVKMFPLSYDTLLTRSPNGNLFIFDTAGNVNSSIQPVVDSYLPSLSGCDELGKVIPQGIATANKALQVSLQNIPGIANTTWPELAEAVSNFVNNNWNSAQEYLPNTVVAVPTASVPNYYQSQTTVPAGTDINDTNYWQPIELGGLQTMQGLGLIESQTTPVSANVNTIVQNQIATGTGQYGSLTYFDFMGLAVNDTVVASNLATVNTAINTIVTAAGAAITNLTEIYTRMLNVANGVYGNQAVGPITVPAGLGAGVFTASYPDSAADLAIQTLASLVPTEVDAIVAAYPAESAAANAAWDNILARMISLESLIFRAGLTPNDLVPSQTSIYSFVQAIPEYARDTVTGGAYQYLESIADTVTEGGQALVGSLREASNQAELDAGTISGRPQTQIPGESTAGNDFVDPTVATGLLDNYPTSRSQINAS
jgi:hypothetical protein